MHRPGNETTLRNLITHIREKMPDITLRTTLITGFPGETKEQFNALGDFVQEMQFDRLGCFAYSEEEGTVAAEYEDQIDEDTRAHRAEVLMQQQADVSAEKNAAKIGKQVEAVIEGFDQWAGCYFGRTTADAPDIDGKIFIRRTRDHQCGDYVMVEVFDTMDYDLLAEEVSA
jgi:ribosomal protein S12 methylthiotransferase